jgi:ActR/RegA family two-component response regulator
MSPRLIHLLTVTDSAMMRRVTVRPLYSDVQDWTCCALQGYGRIAIADQAIRQGA